MKLGTRGPSSATLDVARQPVELRHHDRAGELGLRQRLAQHGPAVKGVAPLAALHLLVLGNDREAVRLAKRAMDSRCASRPNFLPCAPVLTRT
jgi:hypothetical protein